MDATLILTDSDAELLRARALVDKLWNSNDPTDVARQARLIAAYEEMKWPRRPPSVADLICHLMDQHGLTRADPVPLLGTPSRVIEVLRSKNGAQHGNGAAPARPAPCAGRFGSSASEDVAASALHQRPEPDCWRVTAVEGFSHHSMPCSSFRA